MRFTEWFSKTRSPEWALLFFVRFLPVRTSKRPQNPSVRVKNRVETKKNCRLHALFSFANAYFFARECLYTTLVPQGLQTFSWFRNLDANNDRARKSLKMETTFGKKLIRHFHRSCYYCSIDDSIASVDTRSANQETARATDRKVIDVRLDLARFFIGYSPRGGFC
jgi:hypothetical protein